MKHTTDFSKITPCGGDCEQCGFFHDGGCAGCRENGGKCVKMWENGCRIFQCCEEHGAYFCGICWEFPCEYIKNKLAEWDKNGVYKLTQLAREYRELQHKNEKCA